MTRPLSSWTCAVPALCAVHCAAAPLFVGLAPALMEGAALEWVFFAVSAVAAGYTDKASRVTHLHPLIGPLLVFGLCFWGLSLLGVFEPIPEWVTTLAGSLVVASGLFWGGRARRRAGESACGCAECGGAAGRGATDASPAPALRELLSAARAEGPRRSASIESGGDTARY